MTKTNKTRFLQNETDESEDSKSGKAETTHANEDTHAYKDESDKTQ